MTNETISKRDELIRFIDNCFDLVHECSPHNLQRKKEFAIKEIIKLLDKQ